MNFRLVSAALSLVMLSAVSVTAIAADDPIKEREELMEQIGDAAKVIGGMAQGKVDFDAAKAKEALGVMKANAADFPNHFPDGSFEGKTEALPVIAEKRDDFNAKAAALGTAADAAIVAADAGADAFKAAAGAVFGTCKGCHELYRKPQS